jgi:hypothetical protein
VDITDNHAIGRDNWPSGNTTAGGTGQTVEGLDCLPNMPENYHVHTHVSVFLNGEALAIPPDIGIVPQTAGGNCYYNVHTHDRSGKIHVEAEAPGTFTLGQLFAIWGQPLEGANIAGITGLPVVVYVTDAGVVSRPSGDWHAIELTSHREVTIQLGTAITEIPNITWNGN